MRLLRFLIVIVYLSAPTLSYSEDLTQAKKEAIKELLQITGSVKIAELFGNVATQQLIQVYKTTKPDIDPIAFNIIKEEVDALIHEELVIKESFYSYMYPIYHKYLTLGEIKGLIQFYKTPLGSKVIVVLPQMTQEGMNAGQVWGKAIFNPEFKQRISNRFQKEGIEIDK